MRSGIIIIILLNVLLVSIQAQSKKICGDTIVKKYYHDSSFLITVGASDLYTSTKDFEFRFQNQGQIVEIWKEKDSIGGTITNYIFRTKRNLKGDSKTKALSDRSVIDANTASQLYTVINSSGILRLNSDRYIKGWQQGMDGITYIIEHADKNDYCYKTYWTPEAQDSLREAKIVIDFVNNIDTLLGLREKYEVFKEKVPRSGCYSSGGIKMCYYSNFYEVGYSGSIKLPIGYSFGLSVQYIGDFRANLGMSLVHQFDARGYYDFDASLAKNQLFIRSRKGINDYILYNFRQRKYDDIKNGTRYRNHNILYGLNFKSTSLALGSAFINDGNSKVGGSLYMRQYIRKPVFSLYGKTSIFKNRFDYTTGISKSFYIRGGFIKSLSISVGYENFSNHGNLNWGLSVML